MNPHTHLTRARSRQRQRGATLVEAAFMFPMLVICFYASVYMHTYYSSQIDNNTLSRELAWNDSMSNCGSPAGDFDAAPTPAAPTAPLRSTFVGIGAGAQNNFQSTTAAGPKNHQSLSATANDVRTGVGSALKGLDFPGVIGGLFNPMLAFIAGFFPNPNGSQAVATSPFNWRQINGYNGGTGTSQQRTTNQMTTVTCNERPQNGSPATVFKDLGEAIIGAIHP